MTVLVLEALAGMAVPLAILMAIAWMVRERTGNSGWVDTIGTFSVGAAGAGGALWPVAGAAPNPRQWLVAAVFMCWIPIQATGIPPLEQQMLRSRGAGYRDYQARTSAFFPLPPQKGMTT
jgi:steroid 5-alpha reductase family enzyme